MIAHALEHIFGQPASLLRSVSGGDIGSAWEATVDEQRFFCKYYAGPYGHEMALAEKRGLSAIAEKKCIGVPHLLACEPFQGGGLLVLDFIVQEAPSPAAMARLGSSLARLHTQEVPYFGDTNDNFIGRLPQSNTTTKDWPGFYVNHRLFPQFQTAIDHGLLQAAELPAEEKLEEFLQACCEDVRPSLLHGDLWNGNYLVGKGGKPYLIDPSCYRGDALVDIAMSRLFGGFGPAFYEAYYEQRPRQPQEEIRIDLYQLYYLLVHLNLFGRSYKAAVTRILGTYF